MSQRERIEYASAMQLALINGACKAIEKGTAPKTTRRVERVAQRVKLHSEPAVRTRLTYRTAQKLLAAGVIE